MNFLCNKHAILIQKIGKLRKKVSYDRLLVAMHFPYFIFQELILVAKINSLKHKKIYAKSINKRDI